MNELELFSFELDERTFKDRIVYYVQFPNRWQQFLKEKFAESKSRGKRLSISPISFGGKLMTLFPNIFNIHWKYDYPWLLSDETIDVTIVKDLCIKWFAKLEKISVNELNENLISESLICKSAKVGDLLAEEELSSIRYHWIPALMARDFAREKRYLNIKNGYSGHLSFKHIYFNGSHECMSQLIRRHEKTGYFAYVIRFKYKNRGLLPERGILNVEIGMRRFVQIPINGVNDIRWRKNGSILLGVQNILYADSTIESLSVWKFTRRKSGLVWKNDIESLFADALFRGENIQPGEILKDPLAYMKNADFQALAVYNDQVYKGFNRSHTLPGVGLPEKWELFNLVRRTFPELTQLAKGRVVKGWRFSAETLPLLHSYPKNTTISLEIWSDNNLADKVITTLTEPGENWILKEVGPSLYELNSKPKIFVEIVGKPSTGLVHGLETDVYKGDAEERYINKVVHHFKRLEEIWQNKTILSLIEIDEPEKYRVNTDPKQALRTAFAKVKRVSQFIHPLTDDESFGKQKHRIINSFYDLLMDCGFLPQRYNKLQMDETIISLGMLPGYGWKGLPIISSFADQTINIKMFGKNKWLSLQEALFAATNLSENNLLEVRNDGRNKTISFFQRELSRCFERIEGNIVVLVDARVRRWWGNFTNNNLALNKLPLNIKNEKLLRRVRFVRVNQTDEIPQYRINPTGEKKYNREAGLYLDPSGIYYSISQRPDTVRTAVDSQRYTFPRASFWHQRLVEIIPLGCQGVDERNDLAKLVYKMRRLNIAYNVHTILPYPLDLNRSLQKYMTFLSSAHSYGDFDDRVTEIEQLTLDLKL